MNDDINIVEIYGDRPMATKLVQLTVPLDFRVPDALLASDNTPADHALVLEGGCAFLVHSRLARSRIDHAAFVAEKQQADRAHAEEVRRLCGSLEDQLRAQRAAVQAHIDTNEAQKHHFAQALHDAREVVRQAMERDVERYRDQVQHVQGIADEMQRRLRDAETASLRQLQKVQAEAEAAKWQAVEDVRQQVEARTREERERLQEALLSYTARQANSSLKGRDNERAFAELLDRTFGTGRSYRVHPHRIESGDHIVDFDGYRLMFENKKYARDVVAEEVAKAHRDFRAHPDCHALVFVSHDSNILGHQRASGLDVEREAGTGRPIVYVARFDSLPDPCHFLMLLRTVVCALVGDPSSSSSSSSSLSSSSSSTAGDAADPKEQLDDLWADFERTSADLGALQKNLKKHKRGIDRVWRDMAQEVTGLVGSFQARIMYHRRSFSVSAGGEGVAGKEGDSDKEEDEQVVSRPPAKKADRGRGRGRGQSSKLAGRPSEE